MTAILSMLSISPTYCYYPDYYGSSQWREDIQDIENVAHRMKKKYRKQSAGQLFKKHSNLRPETQTNQLTNEIEIIKNNYVGLLENGSSLYL